MIKCTFCKKDAERFGTAILLNQDGDFVCSEDCKLKYNREKDKFFNEIIHDDSKFFSWLGFSEDGSRIKKDDSFQRI